MSPNKASVEFIQNLQLARNVLVVCELRDDILRLSGMPPLRTARLLTEQIRQGLNVPNDLRLLPHEQADMLVQQAEKIYSAAFPLTMVYLASCAESYIESVLCELKHSEYEFRGWDKARMDINAQAEKNLIEDKLNVRIRLGFEIRNLIVHKQSKVDHRFIEKTRLTLQDGTKLEITDLVTKDFLESLEELVPRLDVLLED